MNKNYCIEFIHEFIRMKNILKYLEGTNENCTVFAKLIDYF